MTGDRILEILRALAALPALGLWPSVAWVLDALRHLGGVAAGTIALGLLALPVLFAFRLQRQLNRRLEREPGRPLGVWEALKLDFWCSVLALPVWPFRLVVMLGRLLVRGVRALARLLRGAGKKKAPVESPEEPGAVPPELAPGNAAGAHPILPALLVASLGPSYLLAGLVTVALYVLARLAGPLLRAELGLTPGLSAWQVLLLGQRPELGWYLPLDRFPFLGGILALVLWIVIWALVGIVLRAIGWRYLGKNLAEQRSDRSVLPFWRRWGGLPALFEPAPSYREWAVWPVAAAVPLLGWAWFSVGGTPYRVPFSDFAVGAVLWTSWGLHLLLRGRERRVEEVAPEGPAETAANGWPEVLAWLQAERQVEPPEPFEEGAAEPLLFSEVDPRTAGFLSPLVVQILPAPGKLTPMQRQVLTRLALQGFVHIDPPVALDRLTLGEDVLDILEDRSGQRIRHQIVLAPEGTGKTTLALLAAANHALVHTRATLVVARDGDSAQRTAERFRATLEPSPLRWNVRVRHPGADLMNDLSQGIAPDVVVCGLHDLVTTLLDRVDTFAPFLRNLGLIVVDDVESFAGPVEVHAQLAFRRLALRVEELLCVREFGDKKEESAPQILILGAESLHEMPKWARALCGIDAVVRRFSCSARETGEREAAEMAASGIAVGQEREEARRLEVRQVVAVHRSYRLRDFRTAAGEGVGLEELIAACERLSVPWHYRLCGDGKRELGRGPLLLREEPAFSTAVPEEACVVFLEGTWSEVQRERRRLVRAGARFSRFRRAGGEMVRRSEGTPETVALITRVDPDLEMALTQLDKSFGLAAVLDSLPRPVLRPPTGLAVAPHLAADLSRHWIEVEDILKTFGTSTAATLRRLADGGLLLCEPQTDVEERANEYTEKVYIRALARALQAPGEEEGPFTQKGRDLLPPKVAQVEVAAHRLINVRDRTDLVILGRGDDANAHLVYYPGRIFKDARGTFVVTGRAGDEPDPAAPGGKAPERGRGDVLVEPLLTDEVSSPRRRFAFRFLRGTAAAQDLLEAAGGSFRESSLVLIGRHPFEVALEPVEVRVLHIATCRLGPVHGEIRQRTLLDAETRQRCFDRPLPTVALTLFPNPAPARTPETSPGRPEARLTLEQARVLTALLRALLPSLYRGAGEGLVVALQLEGEGVPGDPHILGPREGLCLFDAEFGGNGTARAIHRDGIELLLRLARLCLERILPLGRLRALYDEWGDEAEIRSEGERGPEPLVPDTGAPDETLRHGLLEWLDSRLQPEGGLEIAAAAAGAREGAEPGEGDTFDLGRCWFSRDDAFADLLWVKHRWRLPGRGEAMLDLAFDRRTEAAARAVAEAPVRLGAYREVYDALLAAPAGRLSDATSRHAPLGVRFLLPEQPEPRTADQLDLDRLRELHAQALALVEAASPVLKPLAGVLLAHSQDAGLETVRALAAFVQGLPFSAVPGGNSEIRPPVLTLLHRLGDGRAKSLLLAVLLRRAGLDAGLFHSFAEERTFAAVAVPEAGQTAVWAEVGGQVFVPIPVRAYADAWTVQVEKPETWAFLPLLLPEVEG